MFVQPVDGGEEIPLSRDGSDKNHYAMLEWAGDSKTLVAFRVRVWRHHRSAMTAATTAQPWSTSVKFTG